MENSTVPSLLNQPTTLNQATASASQNQRQYSELNPPDMNTNQRLCSVQLNDFNYLPWWAVSLALGGRSRIEFIDKNHSAPDVQSSQYKSWFANDQMVQSWLLNTMEQHIAEIFSYSDSAADLWDAVKEMYGNQNNAARVFQLKKDISCLHQEGKSFVQYLGNMKSMWNELAIYRPHTTDTTILLKRAEEDKIFQLLANLSSEYEDLRSRILMNSELPSFANVCATIQREQTRKKVMNRNIKLDPSEARAFVSHQRRYEEKGYKARRPDLKCSHCSNIGHLVERCWELHPELKPKFPRDNKGGYKHPQPSRYKANMISNRPASGVSTFTSSPVDLINEFAAYLNAKQNAQQNTSDIEEKDSSALIGQFAGFLAANKNVSAEDVPGILNAFSSALTISNVHDCWIIDSGATDNITNKRNQID